LGKPVKRRLGGKRLFFINVVLIIIPLTWFGYRTVLRSLGNVLIVDEKPAPADAIIVLAGGDPGRALAAANLYKAKMGRYVVITTETPPAMDEQAKKDGVLLVPTYENYFRVLKGYGVPVENIYRIEGYVTDTYDEIGRVRDLARLRGWTRLIIVTSDFHTRRSRMVARYLLEPEIKTTVVSSHDDSFKPNEWWTRQDQARTFAIEFEKLVTYTMDIWPRQLWKDR
jgi:uncharacterized SAM-binding protein YcdF (DUF218 family)